MSSQDSELHLTPREALLVFDSVDTDKSGKVSLEELTKYSTEHRGDRKKKKSFKDKILAKKEGDKT